MSEDSQDYVYRGRGRGYLINKIKQRPSSTSTPPLSSELITTREKEILSSSKPLPLSSELITSREKQIHSSSSPLPSSSEFDASSVKPRHFIQNSGVPLMSKYIPKEPDENDDHIYETGINSGINFEKFNKIDVKVSGLNIPKKISEFDRNMPESLMKNLQKCKLTNLTPVQQYAIPIILSGKDLMAAAQTGSGKTVYKYCTNY